MIRSPRAARLLFTGALLSVAALRASAQPAPPPTPALPKEVPPSEFTQVGTSNVWYGRTGWTNAGWIDMGDGVLVVDTGAAREDAANIKQEISKTTKGKPIKWFVLTSTRPDVNGGLTSFATEGTTLFVHARAASALALGLRPKDPKSKPPTVVGVRDRVTVISGGNTVELVAFDKPAFSDKDLLAFHRESGAAFVGGLVTPTGCPFTTDPRCDPAGWLQALDQIQSLHPGILLGGRLNASTFVDQEITNTRAYLKRVMDLLVEFKKKDFPESRVAGELAARRAGDYCPIKMDNANVLHLYRRVNAQGVVPSASPGEPAAAKAPMMKGKTPKKR